MNLLPGQPIRLQDDQERRNLGGQLSEYIDDLERDYQPLFDDLRIWWRNYEALPLHSRKDFPFKNASNVVVPFIQMQVDAMVARTYGAIFPADRRVWDIRTENEANTELAANMARYVNWQADGNDFNFKLGVYDWLLEIGAIGSSVFCGNWRDLVRHVFVRRGRGNNRRIISQPVRWARGPILEHTPREQILWDTRTLIQEAPVVVREYAYSWNQIHSMAEGDPRGSWYMNEVQDVKGMGGAHGSAEDVRIEKRRHDSRLAAPANRRADSDHDVREVHIDWADAQHMGLRADHPESSEDPAVYLVGTVHRRTRRLLRLVAQPYFLPYKPFFDGFYRKRSGRGHSVGLSKKLEQLQSSMTTIFNQGIDAQTRANAIWAKTRDRRLKDQPIDPSTPIFVNQMEDFQELKLAGSDFGNTQLLQVAQAMGERLTGQADVAFGRETRLGGHSAPATTTLALLQTADMLNNPMRELMRSQISRMGEFVAAVDQQFEMDEEGRIDRIVGTEDGEILKGFLFPQEPIPTNYVFNVRGLSQDLNPEARAQRAVQVSQMNQNYWSGILRATQALIQLSQAQLPPQLQAVNMQTWIGFIRSHTHAHMRFLEAADVDDIDKFTLALSENERATTGQLRDLADRSTESLGASPAAALNGANGGIPTSVGERAPGSFGAFGGPTVQ